MERPPDLLDKLPPRLPPQGPRPPLEGHERFVAIRKIIDNDIRPYVQADGGDIELVEIEGSRVKVRLHGACNNCPSSMVTLRQGVEARLQAVVAPDLVVEEVA